MATVETRLDKATRGRIETYAKTITELPEQPFVRCDGTEYPTVELCDSTLHALRKRNVLVRVNRIKRSHGAELAVWRVPDEIRDAARDIAENQHSHIGCGHTGIRNIRGSRYFTCTNDNCDAKKPREAFDL